MVIILSSSPYILLNDGWNQDKKPLVTLVHCTNAAKTALTVSIHFNPNADMNNPNLQPSSIDRPLETRDREERTNPHRVYYTSRLRNNKRYNALFDLFFYVLHHYVTKLHHRLRSHGYLIIATESSLSINERNISYNQYLTA